MEGSTLLENEALQDILPLLLQTQDMMTKLESRVIELETDLSTIHRKYEEDHNDWLLNIKGKDQYINYLDSKLQKLEFNSKQVIVLLLEKEETYKNDSTIRLCLNYLRNNEPSSCIAERRTITDDIEEEVEEELMEGLDSFSLDLDSVRHDGSHHTFSTCTSISLHHTSVYNINQEQQQQNHMYQQKLLYQQHQNKINQQESPSCINCKQLLNQLDDQLEQKAYLKRDLSSLASALKESKMFSNCLKSKTTKMCLQIQDINSALFTVLNEIYINHVTNREHLRHENDFVLDLWDARDAPLAQLKQLLVQLDTIIHNDDTDDSAVHGQLEEQQQQRSTFDQYAFHEFQEYLESTNNNISVFWRKIMNEEIEPCLFNKNGRKGKKDWFKRKSTILDAIIKNQCDITPYNNSDTKRCISCNLMRICEFRLDLPDSEGYIDQWCRNKLVAVIDLYQFMLQLKERIKATNELDLFKQVMEYRQRIALARIASI